MKNKINLDEIIESDFINLLRELNIKFPNIGKNIEGFEEIARWFYYKGIESERKRYLDLVKNKLKDSRFNYAL